MNCARQNEFGPLYALFVVVIAAVTAISLASCAGSGGASLSADYSSELEKDSANLAEYDLYWMAYKVPETWTLRSGEGSDTDRTYDIPLGGFASVVCVAGENYPDDIDTWVRNSVIVSNNSSTFENIVKGNQGDAVTYTTDWQRDDNGTKYQGKMLLVFSGHSMYTYAVLLLADAYPTYEDLIDQLLASAQLSATSVPLGAEDESESSKTTTGDSGSAAKSQDSGSSSSSVTTSQKNALAKAMQYLKHTSFSYTGLIDQLEYEGFSTEDSTYGADNCGADWTAQAASKAKQYLSHTAFSYTGLVDQLEYEGFEEDQATYGADNCGADWMEQAAKKAEQYMKHSSFSRDRLISQLEYEGFTSEQAEHGADSVGL